MKLRALILMVCLIMSSVLSNQVYAQFDESIDLNGTLIYRRALEISEEIVSLTSSTQWAFQVSGDLCASVSPNGIHIATSPITGGDINVQRLSTEAIVRQVGWQPTWSNCFFYWITDATLRIKASTSGQAFVDIGVVTGIMSEYVVPPYISPTYSQLPDRFEGQPVLASPNEELYFYERCLGPDSVTTSINEVLCGSDTEWGVYNTTTQQLLLIATTSGHVYLDVRPYSSASYAIWDGVQWSHNSRYLAYVESHLDRRHFPLRIVDTAVGSFIPLSFFNVDVDTERGLYWSPDSLKLAFWVLADLNDIESGTLDHTLVMFDVSANTFVYADQARTPLFGIWAPDGSAFAYVDTDNNLLQVNAVTGTTSQIDANVTRLELWTSFVSPVSQAGPDQTLIDSDASSSEPVTLDGSGSYDPDGTICSYEGI